MFVGFVFGFMVGVFFGIMVIMVVVFVVGFIMIFEFVQGFVVLLMIYVVVNFGDWVLFILINILGMLVFIVIILDGYLMVKQGRVGFVFMIFVIVLVVGIFVLFVLFLVVVVLIVSFVCDYFKFFELFVFVVFGIVIMIGILFKLMFKGIFVGFFGLMFGSVGIYVVIVDQCFMFGVLEFVEGVNFIVVIIGFFGIVELFDQLFMYWKLYVWLILSFGWWWFNCVELKQSGCVIVVGGVVGFGVGFIFVVGGDIVGFIGWEWVCKVFRYFEMFGKGLIEGVVVLDIVFSVMFGGLFIMMMVFGIFGDFVMVVMIGLMIIWGIMFGLIFFINCFDFVVLIVGIMFVVMILLFVLSLVCMKGMVKLFDVLQLYLWSGIFIFCIIGMYVMFNSLLIVVMMFVFGVIGVLFKCMQVLVGFVVFGLLFGLFVEENFVCMLVIFLMCFFFEVVSLIVFVLFVLVVFLIVMLVICVVCKFCGECVLLEDLIFYIDSIVQIEKVYDEFVVQFDLFIFIVWNVDVFMCCEVKICKNCMSMIFEEIEK